MENKTDKKFEAAKPNAAKVPPVTEPAQKADAPKAKDDTAHATKDTEVSPTKDASAHSSKDAHTDVPMMKKPGASDSKSGNVSAQRST